MNDTQLYAQILGVGAPWRVDFVDLKLQDEKVFVSVSFDPDHTFSCPQCSEACPRYDSVKRKWRHLDTCQYETIIEATVPRVECADHGIHQVCVPWAESGSRYTLLFEALVIHWLKEASVSGVAKQMKLSWDAIHTIQKRAVERGLFRREEQSPTDITIDETSEKKGHNYLTVVSEGAKVLFVAEGRDLDTTNGFWETLSNTAIINIRSVSIDLWKAYKRSVLDNIPDAESKLCLDRFHVAGYFNKAVDTVRKTEHRMLIRDGDETLKGRKFDFLRTSSNIDNRSRKSFIDIAHSSLKTSRAWAIKETAHLLWNYLYLGAAEKKWKKLLAWMSRSRLAPMVKLAKTIREHLWMILNAIKFKASSGSAEGNNSRIQRIKKMACGFRNPENFKNAIYFHLGGLDLEPRI